jgi:hypothetical protein
MAEEGIGSSFLWSLPANDAANRADVRRAGVVARDWNWEKLQEDFRQDWAKLRGILSGSAGGPPVDYGMVAETAAAAFVGGAILGGLRGRRMSAMVPLHQRRGFIAREGFKVGLNFASFSGSFSLSMAVGEAARGGRPSAVDGAYGGAIAGMVFGSANGIRMAITGFLGGGLLGLSGGVLLAESRSLLRAAERDREDTLALSQSEDDVASSRPDELRTLIGNLSGALKYWPGAPTRAEGDALLVGADLDDGSKERD